MVKPLCVLSVLLYLPVFAQDTLTNDSIIKLVKGGLTDSIIVSMINTQPGKYSVSADRVLELKNAGVSDAVLTAMINRSQAAPASPTSPTPAPATASTPVPTTATATAAPVGDVGVYWKRGEEWAELLPEVINWKTGGVIKSVASVGVVKKDINGRLNGPHSRNSVKTPVEILIYAPEGAAITEYQFLRLRDNKDAREFRSVTGGVFNQSGGVTRDLVPFEGKKVGNRLYTVLLPPSLGVGEYGFLPPGALPSGSTNASLGKMYTFRIVE